MFICSYNNIFGVVDRTHLCINYCIVNKVHVHVHFAVYLFDDDDEKNRRRNFVVDILIICYSAL